jgi:DNA uptake protein ComE-like DNA-binding protein
MELQEPAWARRILEIQCASKGQTRVLQRHAMSMKVRLTVPVLVLSAAALLFTGCTKPTDPNQVREKTAETTAEMKNDAKAVVQGIKEGLQSPAPPADHPVDLNSASKARLTGLPGLSGDDADRIIAARPYASKQELLDRHIVSGQEYRRIADSIVVKERDSKR